MKRTLILFFMMFESLFALTLNQYLNLSLQNSNDVKLLVDNELNLKLNLSLEKNIYSSNYSPTSSINVDDDSNSFSLGFRRTQKNMYGGELSSTLDTTRTEYNNIDTIYSPTLSIGYTQSLFKKFGKTYNTLTLYTAKEKLDLVKLVNITQRAEIILKAVSYYYDVSLNNEKIKIQKKSLLRSEGNYKAASAKQESGIVSKIDVHRAKLAFLEQKKRLKDSIKRYKDSLENLYFYINQNVNEKVKIEPINFFEYNIDKFKNSEVLSRNLIWNEMLLDEKILNREIYNSEKNFLPDINLNLNYSLSSSSDNFNNSFDFNEDDWGIGLSSNYNFNTTEQSINNQRIIIRKAKLLRDKDALKRFIFKDINTLKNNYQNILENMEIYKLKQIEAKESLDIAKIRYERGLSSNLDVLDAESSYSSSLVEYITEVVRHNIALLKLRKAKNRLNLEFIEKEIF